MKESRTKYGNPVLYFGLTEGKPYKRKDGSKNTDFIGSFEAKINGKMVRIVISVSDSVLQLDNGKASRLCQVVIVENQADKRFSR